MKTRTVLGLLAAGATIGSLTFAAPAAHAATQSYDTAPQSAAITWGRAQLDNGVLDNAAYAGANVGATIDFASSLRAIDPQADIASEISGIATGLENGYADADEWACPGNPNDYSCDPVDDVDYGPGYYANGTAKALAFAEATGQNVATYGGRNLQAQLEGLVQTDGSIHDVSIYGDYANVFGQAFALSGLTAAGSAEAPLVASYLLGLQNPSGFFPEQFSGTTPSVDATATALLQLESIDAPTTAESSAIASAASWLVRVQGSDGGWSSDTGTTDENANSTGLAGWALGQHGDLAPASKAAAWVAALQLTGSTYAAVDRGAIAYDATALADAVTGGTANDQFRVAISQALPVLSWLPATVTPPATPSTPTSAGSGAKTTVHHGSTQVSATAPVAASSASDWTPPSTAPSSTGITVTSGTTPDSGATVTITASGFPANEQGIAIVVYSTPQILGLVNADANGAITWTGMLPADLEAGTHTLTAQDGTVARGYAFTVTNAVQQTVTETPAVGTAQVKAAAKHSNGGFPAWGWIVIALLAVAGAGVVVRMRRRS